MTTYKASSTYADTPISSDNYLDLYVPKLITTNNRTKTIIVKPEYQHRPDKLSYELYGTSEYWWVFAQVNKNKIKDPIYDFISGLEINVPSIEDIR